MQPRMTQVPPKPYSSATATRAPVCAASRLARTPPDPPPMTNRSKSYFEDITPSPSFGADTAEVLQRTQWNPFSASTANPSTSALCFFDDFDSATSGDEEGGGEVEEKAVVNHARNDVECDRQEARIADGAEAAIIDQIAAVGDETIAKLRA